MLQRWHVSSARHAWTPRVRLPLPAQCPAPSSHRFGRPSRSPSASPTCLTPSVSPSLAPSRGCRAQQCSSAMAKPRRALGAAATGLLWPNHLCHRLHLTATHLPGPSHRSFAAGCSAAVGRRFSVPPVRVAQSRGAASSRAMGSSESAPAPRRRTAAPPRSRPPAISSPARRRFPFRSSSVFPFVSRLKKGS